MPKITPLPVDAMTRHITNNIKSRAGALGIETDKELCKKIVMSRSTFGERKKNPRTWSVEELAQVAITLKCTLSWLVTEHTEKIKDVDKGGG